MLDDPMHDSPMQLAQKVGHKDPQAAGIIAMLGQYEEEFNGDHGERGWDWPLELIMIYRHLPPTELADEIAEEMGAQLYLMAMKKIANLTDLGVNCDGGPHIAAFLSWFADTMRGSAEEGTRAMMSDLLNDAPDLVAWGLHMEGYELVLDRNEEAPDTPFKDDPRSIECRLILAVDRAGCRYTIRRMRPNSRVDAMVDMRSKEFPDWPRNEGRVIDALAEVMAATPGDAV